MALTPMPIQVPIFSSPSGLIADVWRIWFRAAATAIGVSAPVEAAYLIATVNSTLTAPRNLGLLTTGHLSITVALGVATPTTSATIPSADLSGALPAISGAALTALTSSALSGALPAISGAALTALTSSALSGALPAISGAALTGLTSSQVTDLASGIYTPGLTNAVNVAASTAYSCQYLRVGTVVTVSGQVDVDPTGLGDTQLGIALPIASNFANANECGGAAAAPGIAGESAGILADAANNRATLQWTAVDLTNQAFRFVFSYRVMI